MDPIRHFTFDSVNAIPISFKLNGLLKCELHTRNIINNPICSSGRNKDVHHFFFACKNCTYARNIFKSTI